MRRRRIAERGCGAEVHGLDVDGVANPAVPFDSEKKVSVSRCATVGLSRPSTELTAPEIVPEPKIASPKPRSRVVRPAIEKSE